MPYNLPDNSLVNIFYVHIALMVHPVTVVDFSFYYFMHLCQCVPPTGCRSSNHVNSHLVTNSMHYLQWLVS